MPLMWDEKRGRSPHLVHCAAGTPYFSVVVYSYSTVPSSPHKSTPRSERDPENAILEPVSREYPKTNGRSQPSKPGPVGQQATDRVPGVTSRSHDM